MSFGEGNLRERVEGLERERDYWKRECADMLSEFWDTESGHCAILDYPRPASEPAPSVIVMASRMGNDEYRERAEKRIAELESSLNDVADKWAEAQVDAEVYAKRCNLLELLVRDMWDTMEIDTYSYDPEEHIAVRKRMDALGLLEGGE